MASLVYKKCDYCGKEFSVEYRMRNQKFCSSKCSHTKSNLKKEYVLKCDKCGKEYKIYVTPYKYEKGKFKKYCSRECANGRNWSEDYKKKLSKICKNSEKVKEANKIFTENRKRAFDEGRNKRKLIPKEFVCLYCGKIGISKKENKKYHSECWLKASGGIRKGSSRGKHGWYKGIWCDSSYELAFVIYCLEHNIKIERNTMGYEYIYNNKKHTYYPDFIVNGKLMEIKNYRSELTNVKLNSVKKEIDILYRDTIKPYINYVKNKYGKNFINLYDKESQTL